MGIVHHPRYLVYFEIARTEYLRDLGLPYAGLVDSGTHLAVIEVAARYVQPARYDEAIEVVTSCSECGRTRLTLDYEVRRGDTLLATGSSRHAAVDHDGRPRRLPAELRELLSGEIRTPAE